MTPETPKSANELAAERTVLAVKRNLMACDRTLMAWVRTALSMISFGFTLYKVLEGFQKSGQVLPAAHTPRNVGLFLVGLGTVSMVTGTVEYWQSLKDLGQTGHFGLRRPSFVIAVILSVTGLILFLGILTRIL